MKINIQSPGFTPKPALINFVHKEIDKFSCFYETIIGSEVCLRLDSSSANENKNCRIRLLIPGNDLLATAQCKTFEEAIAQSVEALEKQIKKRKTKITGRRKDIIEAKNNA